MIYINIEDDENLKEILNQCISGLLPHENFDIQYSGDILDTLFRYVKLEEYSLDYYVVLYIINEIQKINRRSYYKSVEDRIFLSKEVFEISLERNMEILVSNPNTRMKQYLELRGLPSNLSLEENMEQACQILYEKSIELYETCFELARPSSEISGLELALRGAIKQNIGISLVQAQAQILNNYLYIGRKMYKGSEDWLEYTYSSMVEVKSRFEGSDNEEDFDLNDLDKTRERLKKFSTSSVRIGSYGIPPLDERMGLRTNNLSVIVARHGTGKTNTVCKLTASLLIESEKNKIVLYCTESKEEAIYYKIMASYLHQKDGICVPYDTLGRDDLLPEEIKRRKEMLMMEWSSTGRLHISKNVRYDNFKQKTEDLIVQKGYNTVIVDHTGFLGGLDNDGIRGQVTTLGHEAVEIKNNYPVQMILCSHPSSELLAELKKFGRHVGANETAHSSDISRDADLVMVLNTNESLERQEKVTLQVTKIRGESIKDIMVLKRDFAVCDYEYAIEDQAVDANVELNAEEFANNLDSQLEGQF